MGIFLELSYSTSCKITSTAYKDRPKTQTMIQYILNAIKRLFGIKDSMPPGELEASQKAERSYEDATKPNVTAIFANKLAAFVVTDSTIDVYGENDRAQFLEEIAVRFWKKSKRIVARSLGTGGVVIVPHENSGRILFDILDQSRLVIHQTVGEHIISASIVAERIWRGTQSYTRLMNFTLTDAGCVVKQKAVNEGGGEVQLADFEEWENITPEYVMSGVDKMPFAYLKSPVDNRKTRDNYGVPVTYGCERDVDELEEAYRQMRDEFQKKRVFIFADERIFDERDELVKSGLLKSFRGADLSASGSITDYSPAIRDASYMARIDELCRRIEKSVGTSQGILTEQASRGATATEIKAALYDTYSMVEIIRQALSDALLDFLTACDVLANAYGMTPPGEWGVVYDWSYQFVESSTETFNQMMQAESIGVISKAEVRQFLRSDESLEDAEEKVRVIAETRPVTPGLDFGGGFGGGA